MHTTNEPMILADGSRGIYAMQTAARNLLAMSQGNRWDLAYIDRADLEAVAATDMGQATDEEAECVLDAWDTIVRNLEARRPGESWHLWQDGDIFLIPEGYDMEQQ